MGTIEWNLIVSKRRMTEEELQNHVKTAQCFITDAMNEIADIADADNLTPATRRKLEQYAVELISIRYKLEETLIKEENNNEK